VPKPVTVRTFLKRLRASGAVPRARLDAYLSELGELPREPERLAKIMVRDRLLSPLQTYQFLREKPPSRWEVYWAVAGGLVGAVALAVILAAYSRPPAPELAPAPAPSPTQPAPRANARPAPVTPAVPPRAGLVKVVHVESGKLLTAAGGQLHLAPDTGAETQQWLLDPSDGYFKLEDPRSGKVLDVLQNLLDEGAPVGLHGSKSRNDNNQLWSWDSSGEERRLVSRLSGLVLDVDGQGQTVQNKPDEKARGQLWRVVEVGK
jgi:hypothetical protein